MGYWDKREITWETTDEQLNKWTVVELKNGISQHEPVQRGTKMVLLNQASHIRRRLKDAHDEQVRFEKVQHQTRLNNERHDQLLGSIRSDVAGGLSDVLTKAHEAYNERLKQMQDETTLSGGVAHWVKWHMESALNAEAWYVEVRPLATWAEKHMAADEITMEEYCLVLDDEYDRTVKSLTDNDPESWGMESGQVALAKFRAKQRLAKLLKQVIGQIANERHEYTGRCTHFYV